MNLRPWLRAALFPLLLLLPGSMVHAVAKASYQHYLKALLLSNRGSYSEALHEYEAALALDPQSSFMYEAAAELALETGKTARALELARRFVELSPTEPAAYFLLGNVQWARGDWESAKGSFEKTLELKPDYREALYTLGNLLSAQSPAKAKQYLLDYLAENPDNASDAEYHIALIEQKGGHLDEAIAHFKSSIASDPENMQARYSLAQVYEVRRDTEAALAAYVDILRYDSRNVALLNHVGEIYFLRNDIERAREHFGRAKEIMPTNSATCLWLALLAEQEKDFKGAAAHVKDSAALKTDAALNLRLSYYLTQDNRLKEAVAVLEGAHKKWPKNDELTYFLALGYDDLGLTGKSIRLMREVLKLRPDHRDARFQLGAMYEKKGDIVNAEVQFRAIIEKHPLDGAALNYLGYSFADRGLKLKEAEALIRRAVKLNPENGAYVDSLGWVYFRQGRRGEALAELKKASALLPEDDAVWTHLGDVYRVYGDTVSAWDAWKTAQGLAPAKSELAKKLAKAESILSAEELGRRYQDFLGRGLGNLASYGGPCAIEGKVAGRTFQFQGILHFKAPWELSIDVLGPLFVPMFRAAIRGQAGFEMDPLDIKGVPPEVMRENLFAAMQLLRDYLEGRFFREQPSEYRRKWRSRWIVTPAGTLYLDRSQVRVAAVEGSGERAYRLELSDMRRVGGKWLPATLKLRGKGFFLQFRLSSLSAGFN